MPTLEQRAQLHAALGDPLRLAIVDELTASDRAPGELAARLDVPGNLLAHHLDVLERVGVIRRSVSSADRRRRYVRLVRPRLFDLAPVTPRPTGQVLFVCTRNSARSQLAAALWRVRTGGPATSAGTHPATHVHPGALAAAKRADLDLRSACPRSIAEAPDADLVVTVCDQAHEELGPAIGEPALGWWHWSIPDPVRVGDDQAFDATIRDLGERIVAVTVATDTTTGDATTIDDATSDAARDPRSHPRSPPGGTP